MLKRIFQLFFVLVGSWLGYELGPLLFRQLNNMLNIGDIGGQRYIGAALGAVIFLLATNWLVNYLVKAFEWGEERLVKLPIIDFLIGTIGLIVGLIVGFLLFLPISNISLGLVSDYLPLFVSGLLGYLGFVIRAAQER